MEPIALTRASQLIHATETLERLGQSPERMLRRAKLPMWQYCDPDDLIPAHHIYLLMDEAARALDVRSFGLLVGADSSIDTLGTFGRLIAAAPTVYHAIEASCRLTHLHTSAAHSRLFEAGDGVWFCSSPTRGPKAGRREMEQYSLMRLIELPRLAAGPLWRPAKVCLQTQEAPDPALRETLGDAEILSGQEFTGIAVPRALLSQPLRRGSATRDEVTEVEERWLRRTAPASSFVETLRQLAATLLKDETPRIETMAEIAGLSVRSLQRRLARHGVTHSQIVDRARFRAATRLLEGADHSITQIAMDVGYADSAHFTRAFKRWAGVTPRDYRNRHRLH